MCAFSADEGERVGMTPCSRGACSAFSFLAKNAEQAPRLHRMRLPKKTDTAVRMVDGGSSEQRCRVVYLTFYTRKSRRTVFYFAPAVAGAAAPPAFWKLYVPPNFLLNRSTRPAESTNFCLPVKNGWQFEQISTARRADVLRVVNVLPHAQWTV